MTNKDILQAAEENAMQYCMHRGVAKGAFVEGALWAMQECRKMIQDVGKLLNTENYEAEM